ncbi:MAG: DNA topoisomerase VI subunit B [Planctomycetota bacterium]
MKEPAAKAVPDESPVPAKAAPKKPRPRRTASERTIAHELAAQQREISVSEFFAKNRHLLGFDNPRKALLTSVKEAVDNALDACEEAGVLPEVHVAVREVSADRFTFSVQDNGPGILPSQIPNIFGKLLYGSKFHRLRQSRGQQGIGISAAGMYGLMTTGQSVRITSRTNQRSQAHYYEIQIDTRKNRPEIIRDEKVEWDAPHGTKVEITLTGKYQKGRQSVDAYIQQTAIANPHATIHYEAPDGERQDFPRAANEMPRQPREIRPHPYGVELGVLIRMLKDTRKRNLQAFLTHDFSRVSPRVADAILSLAKLPPNASPTRIGRHEAETLFEAIGKTKIMAPPTDCVVPIGEEGLLAGLKKTVQADFYTAATRSPAVYRGNPFVIEAALAFGGSVGSEEDLMQVLRFANRVPLLHQQGACVIYQTILDTNWRLYGLAQSRGALPTGPVLAVVHIASAWVPFTSESKEAVADYPEIEREIRLALQECARRLKLFVNKRRRQEAEMLKRSYIEKYLPHVAEALRDILALNDRETRAIVSNLATILEKTRTF